MRRLRELAVQALRSDAGTTATDAPDGSAPNGNGTPLPRPVLDQNGVPVRPDIEKALSVVRRILSASDGDFSRRSFFFDAVCEYGTCFNDWNAMSQWLNVRNTSTFGLQQIPSEFADFTFHLSKLNIESAIEVGVYQGASSYFLAAILKRANPSAHYTMVDIADSLIGFDDFASILPLKKAIPSTSSDFRDQAFDFVFIDGDHSYVGAMRDYLNLGRRSKIAVAFHDIHGHEFDHLDGGTVRVWAEFRQANTHRMHILEFSHSLTPWMGIGLGVKDRE